MRLISALLKFLGSLLAEPIAVDKNPLELPGPATYSGGFLLFLGIICFPVAIAFFLLVSALVSIAPALLLFGRGFDQQPIPLTIVHYQVGLTTTFAYLWALARLRPTIKYELVRKEDALAITKTIMHVPFSTKQYTVLRTPVAISFPWALEDEPNSMRIKSSNDRFSFDIFWGVGGLSKSVLEKTLTTYIEGEWQGRTLEVLVSKRSYRIERFLFSACLISQIVGLIGLIIVAVIA